MRPEGALAWPQRMSAAVFIDRPESGACARVLAASAA
jgi:hypothetical protein